MAGGWLLVSAERAFLVVLLKQCPPSSRFPSLSCAENPATQTVSCACLPCLERQLCQGRGWSCLVSGVSLVLGGQSPAAGGTPKHGMRGMWSGGDVAITGDPGTCWWGTRAGRGEGQACWGRRLRTAGRVGWQLLASAPDSWEAAAAQSRSGPLWLQTGGPGLSSVLTAASLSSL